MLRTEVEALGPAQTRVGKSAVTFVDGASFAWAWVPDRYLRGSHAPLVLSLAFRERDDSPRFKEIVEPRPGIFMHHLELHSTADIDEDVRRWIARARAERAG